MKLRLIAFFFCALSLTMILGAYGVQEEDKDLPNAMYAGGRIYRLHLPVAILAILAIMSAFAGVMLLIALARKQGRAATATKTYRASWLCLAPTLLYVIHAGSQFLLHSWK